MRARGASAPPRRIGQLRNATASSRSTTFIKIGKVMEMTRRGTSPIGTDASQARRRRGRRSGEYRAEQERLAPFEEIARLVIKHRAALGLTQAELAARMGTSHSAISRIESGQHRTSLATLQRLAEALDVRFVAGFESGPKERPVRELVSV